MNLPLCYILDLHSNHGGLAIVIVTIIHHIYFQFHCHDHQPWAHCRSLSGCRRPPRRPCPASSPSSPPCSPWTIPSSEWGQNRECKGQNHELRIRVVKNSLNNILWLNHVICHKTLAKWKCRIKRWRYVGWEQFRIARSWGYLSPEAHLCSVKLFLRAGKWKCWGRKGNGQVKEHLVTPHLWLYSLYFRLDLLLGRFCQLRRVRARCQYELSPRSVAWTVLSCTISVERRKLTLVCRFTNTIQSCVSFHLLVCLFTCDFELVKAALL